MRLHCNFTITAKNLKDLIKRARNFNKKLCLEALENPNMLQKISQNTKYDILLICAAATLLETGLDEERAYKILENFLEIDNRQLSPESKLIH